MGEQPFAECAKGADSRAHSTNPAVGQEQPQSAIFFYLSLVALFTNPIYRASHVLIGLP